VHFLSLTQTHALVLSYDKTTTQYTPYKHKHMLPHSNTTSFINIMVLSTLWFYQHYGFINIMVLSTLWFYQHYCFYKSKHF